MFVTNFLKKLDKIAKKLLTGGDKWCIMDSHNRQRRKRTWNAMKKKAT